MGGQVEKLACSSCASKELVSINGLVVCSFCRTRFTADAATLHATNTTKTQDSKPKKHYHDDLLRSAELVISAQMGSTSMLQRKLRLPFTEVGKIMDDLEELGVVGPSTGARAREVNVSICDLESKLAELKRTIS